MRSGIFALTLVTLPFMGVGQMHVHIPPRVPWATPDAGYPLKVHVLSSDRSVSRHAGFIDTHSYGSANLLGDPKIGLDYTSNCEGGFLHNAEGADFYQGRWKKQDRRIEILLVQAGSTRMEKCDIDVTVKPAPYGKDNPPPKLVTAH